MERRYRVLFYRDQNGRQPVRELLVELETREATSKNARIQRHKILTYIDGLRTYGTRIGEPQVKYLGDDLWELRPLHHRILFFYWRDNTFVLLHHFIKKTQKTPPREIEQAKRNLRDHLERSK